MSALAHNGYLLKVEERRRAIERVQLGAGLAPARPVQRLLHVAAAEALAHRRARYLRLQYGTSIIHRGNRPSHTNNELPASYIPSEYIVCYRQTTTRHLWNHGVP